MKFPTFVQWKQFLNLLSRKDKIAFIGFGTAAVISAAVFCAALYYENTKVIPSDNGVYAEGAIGAPTFLNPLYSDFSSIDRDITELLFTGLLKYDENNQIIPNLADYKILDGGKTYEFILKDNLHWSDGKTITSDDVLYTIATIQDPAYKSPLRSQWIGVKTERISDTGFRFSISGPNAAFLESCTLKILPKHIWEKITPESFALSPYNLNPVVSGPYMVKKLNLAKNGTVTSIDLEKNPEYSGNSFNFKKVSFVFFSDYDALAAAFKRGQIQGFVPGANFENRRFSDINILKYSLPRYFAVFFNSAENKIFEDQNVRAALSYATDKNAILNGPLEGLGKTVDSPILAETYGIQPPTETYNYDLGKASEILDKAGYKMNSDNLRVKTVSRTPAFQFTKNLKVGSTATGDIKELQKCLAKEVAPDLEANGNFGKGTEEAVKKFQEKYRDYILDPQKIATPNGEVRQATREKLNMVCFPSGNEDLAMKIVLTVVNQEPFMSAAQTIKDQWAKIGASVEIKSVEINALERDIIKPRIYQALLFGEAFGAIPDPYPFWHSTQKEDPGLNFSLFDNKDADKLLEDIRKDMDPSSRKAGLDQLQNLISKEAPLILLYNPDYLFVTSTALKGAQGRNIIVPGQRFADFPNWYTATKRVFK